MEKLITTPPNSCPSCGLEHSKCTEEGFKEGFLMFPLPIAGTALCACPRCFALMMNVECFENQKLIREKQESRIIKLTK